MCVKRMRACRAFDGGGRRRYVAAHEPQTSTIPAGRSLLPTALLVLADGTVLEGIGLGATGHAVGEVCFNTAMTGYEEILTDPSYAGQIITFTFPHIGNVGTNEEDIETVNMAATPGARGVILRAGDHRSRRTTAPRGTSTSGSAPRHHRALPASTRAR